MAKMSTYEHKMLRAVEELLGKVDKLTQALSPAELPEGLGLDPWAAIYTLQQVCCNAAECSQSGCPVYEWCSRNIPDDRIAPAPKDWRLTDE